MIGSARRSGRLLVAGAALLCAALAGCGGSTSAAGPAPTRAAPEIDPGRGLTQGQAERALLVVGDLPLGFTPEDGAAEASALGCAGIDGVYLADGAAARASVSFGHAISAAYVNETITTRPGAAAPALAAFARAARDCASFTGLDGTAYTVTALPLPRYGDGSAAVRVASSLSEGRPVELAAVRLGDTILAVASAGTGAADAELTRLVVGRAMAKISRSR